MADFTEITTTDMNAPWDGKGLPPGVRGMMKAMLGAAIVLGVPYVVALILPAQTVFLCPPGDEPTEAAPCVDVQKAAERLCAWLPGDPLFDEMFLTSASGGAAEGGLKKHGLAPGGGSILGEVDMGAAGGDAPLPEGPVVLVTPETGHRPATREGSSHSGAPDVQGAQGGDATAAGDTGVPAEEHPYARIAIPAASWEGLTTFIEDERGVMGTFYRQLAKVVLKEPGAKVRIAQWGDSAIAADGMTSAARRLLQRAFGDGGHGYAMVSASKPWYLRKDIVWTTAGWNTEEYIGDMAPDRRYGFGGMASVGYPGARASWKTLGVDGGEKVKEGTPGRTASHFEVHYLKQKGGGKFAVRIDGEEVALVDTASTSGLEDAYYLVDVPDAPHTLEVRATGGKAKVYGVVVERAGGVVYDGMGVVGARDSRWLNVDEGHHIRALQQRSPDLSILMYGGNQLEDKVTMDWYRGHLRTVLARWKKALPSKSCMLMSAIDHGEHYRGRIRTVPRQLEIMEVQRELAREVGCAWFSLYEAMGGNGAIGRWFDEGLASGDFAHPTAKGSVRLGQIFTQALMKGFHDWLEAERVKDAGAP